MNSHRHFLATILHLYDDSLFYYLIKLNYQDNKKKTTDLPQETGNRIPLFVYMKTRFLLGLWLLFSNTYICIVVGDPVIKMGGDKIIRFNPHHIFLCNMNLTNNWE